jgi:hypothetical protein
MRLRFRARIAIATINPYVLVDAARATRLAPGWRKPMPVRIQINGKPDPPWRINLMPIGDGSFTLYLHGDVRKASRTKVDDVVEVAIGFDDDYRGGPQPLPNWFAGALARDARASRGWAALTPSRQKELARYLARLKSPAAQARNAKQALHVLAGGMARFMARNWNARPLSPRPGVEPSSSRRRGNR